MLLSLHLWGRLFAPATTTASKLIVLGDDTLTTVDISNFTTANILEKGSRPSGVDYKREIEPLYLDGRVGGKDGEETLPHP